MLGKLIKLDLRFRYKKLLTYSAAIIIFGILVLIFEQISKALSGESLASFMNFYTTYFVLYIAILLVFPLFMFVEAIIDFNSRYFNEQSYLTHTLPVTTGKLISSRLVSDILIAIGTIVSMIISVLFTRQSFFSLGEIEIGLKPYNNVYGAEKTFLILDEITYYINIITIILILLWFIYFTNAFTHLLLKSKALALVLAGASPFVYSYIFSYAMSAISTWSNKFILYSWQSGNYKPYLYNLICFIEELMILLLWVITLLIIRYVLKKLFKKKLNIV